MVISEQFFQVISDNESSWDFPPTFRQRAEPQLAQRAVVRRSGLYGRSSCGSYVEDNKRTDYRLLSYIIYEANREKSKNVIYIMYVYTTLR